MASRRASITQSELERILKAHRNAGVPVVRTEIDPSGRVVVFVHDDDQSGGTNPWDEVAN